MEPSAQKGSWNVFEPISVNNKASSCSKVTARHFLGVGVAGLSSRSDTQLRRHHRPYQSSLQNLMVPHPPAHSPSTQYIINSDHSEGHSHFSQEFLEVLRHETISANPLHSPDYRGLVPRFDEMTGGLLPAARPKTVASPLSSSDRHQTHSLSPNHHATKKYSIRASSSPWTPQREPVSVNGVSPIPMPSYGRRKGLTDDRPNGTPRQGDSTDQTSIPTGMEHLLGQESPDRRFEDNDHQATAPQSRTNIPSKTTRSNGRNYHRPTASAELISSPPLSDKANGVEKRTPGQRNMLRLSFGPSPASPTTGLNRNSHPVASSDEMPTANSIPPSVESSPRPEVCTVCEFSISAFRQVFSEAIKDIRLEHEYAVRARLGRARAMQDGLEVNIPPASRPTGTGSSQKPLRQKKSPFTGMGSIAQDTRSLFSSQTIMNLSQHFSANHKEHSVLTAYELKSYDDDSIVIPPYNNYISTRRNILVEDEKHRISVPYLGEDPQQDPEFLALENKISRNARYSEKLKLFAEKANQYRPYIEEILRKLGTDVDSVLHYLLNKREPSYTYRSLKSNQVSREDHLQDGYYSQSDDSGTINPDRVQKKKRPQKQWRKASVHVGKQSNQDKLDRAVLACDLFSEVAGFSLWFVVKETALIITDGANTTLISPTNGSKSASPERYDLSTYAELGCLVCKGHECPGHGEYEDDRDEKNLRVRVNHREYAKIGKKYRPDREHGTSNDLPLATNIHEALGLDEDGHITGGTWSNVHTDNDDILPEAVPCSADCFWLKSNRTRLESATQDEWSKVEALTLKTLRPAYDDFCRAPCLIHQSGLIKRSCFSIFERMFNTKRKETKISFKTQNTIDATRTKGTSKRPGAEHWEGFHETWMHHTREPFIPCNHKGPCDDTTECDCVRLGITCEKFCACPDNCKQKFRGCTCAAKNKACHKSDSCECARLNRECDPDLCRSCGAHEVLDPVNKYNSEILQGKCSNVYIQRGVPKRTLLGHSKLMAEGGRSGFGLYMGEPCKKNEYVGEYVGEVISSNEADQRGIIYDKRNMSYLFDVNKLQTLDSTLVGNKLRFINHQPKDKVNVQPHTTFCNTVQRMGMFATRDIEVGEELFFNYGEAFAAKHDLIIQNAQGGVTTVEHTKEKSSGATLAAQYRKGIQKVTLSKNGHRIGRPPKSPGSREAEEEMEVRDRGKALAGLSMTRAVAGVPEVKGRKRRYSSMDGAMDIPDSDATDASDDSDESEEEASLSPINSSSDDSKDSGTAFPVAAEDSSSDGDDNESVFDSEDAAPRRKKRKQRKRRKDFGIKKGPRPMTWGQGTVARSSAVREAEKGKKVIRSARKTGHL